MENDIIIEQMLSDLLQKTIEKKVPWTLVNNNAVRWVKQNQAQMTHVTLQKQLVATANNPARENYVLTIQEPPSVSIQINTAIDSSKREILGQLFRAAMLTANDKTIETLKNLLKGL